MRMRIEIGGKGAEGLDRGHRARPYAFAVKKLLEAFEDALIGALQEKGK